MYTLTGLSEPSVHSCLTKKHQASMCCDVFEAGGSFLPSIEDRTSPALTPAVAAWPRSANRILYHGVV